MMELFDPTPVRLKLWPFQERCLDELADGLRSGKKRQILSAPTGAGKTEMAISLMERALRKGSRALFVADRIPLVSQMSKRMLRYGVPHGVLQGESTFGEDQRLRICSVQTLEARSFPEDIDLVLIDEAHGSRRSLVKFMRSWGGPVVGLTATPLTEGLGRLYDGLVTAAVTDDLIRQGYLAPIRAYALYELDMEGAAIGSDGEWKEEDISERSVPLVADMVDGWEKMTSEHFGGPVKTLVFSASVRDGAAICEAFAQRGLDFRQTTYRDDARETHSLVGAFKRDEFTGLVSVEKMAKGFDVPDVKCVIGARPYRNSLSAFLQPLGRGMRAADGKEYCLYLDCAGNFAGWYDRVVDFWANGARELDGGARNTERPVRREGAERVAKTCRCGMVLGPEDQTCPGCGRARPVRPPVDTVSRSPNMDFIEYPTAPDSRLDALDRRRVWGQICKVALLVSGGGRPVARRKAESQYRRMYGETPPWAWGFRPMGSGDRFLERRLLRDMGARPAGPRG